MKNLLLLFLLFCHSQVFAQNGFFVQPTYGSGFTNTTELVLRNLNYENVPELTNKIQLLFGYTFKNIIFKTGVSSFKTGSVYEDNNADPPGVAMVPIAWSKIYYNYIALPISVGYNIKVNQRFSISPYLGYSLGFATSMQRVIYSLSDSKIFKTYTNPASGTNSFTSMQFEIAYRLNSKLQLTATPEAQFMVPHQFDLNYFHTSTNARYFESYTYTLNIGIKYLFSHQHKEVKPVNEQNGSNTLPIKKTF